MNALWRDFRLQKLNLFAELLEWKETTDLVRTSEAPNLSFDL